MGKADFSCEVGCELVGNDNDRDILRIRCYWKNNGWTYHMQPVYGWVTCNGEERLVYNAGYPDFTSNSQARYELGYSDYSIWRNHGTINSTYSARLRSDSSYASGERWSSSGTYATGAKPSYTVSYNANGGTGAPGNQTKWWNETLTLSGTKPTKTGHTFQGWSTSSTGGVNYASGAAYTGNSGMTLYAVWKANTWTVSYNANGGTRAPGNQTKTYNQTLTLSSTKPTRANYIFQGWATSANGSVAYQPGGSYTANAAVTLYAIWKVAYNKPRITSFSVQRCNSGGTNIENGTYLKINAKWASDLNATKVKARWKLTTDTTWTEADLGGTGAKSGTVTNKVVGANAISTDKTYIVQVYVADGSDKAHTGYSSEIQVSTQKFPIDVKAKGNGVAFGKAAEKDNAVEIGFKEIWLGGIKIIWYAD